MVRPPITNSLSRRFTSKASFMKNIFLFCLAFAFAALISFSASAQVFQRGDNLVTAGISFGSGMGNFDANHSSPGISLTYELGYYNLDGPGVLGLGAYVGHKNFSNTGTLGNSPYSQKWSYTVIGFRANYHYQGLKNLPHLDPYGGLMLSYNAVNYTFSSPDGITDPSGDYNGSLGLSLYAGSRWFFTKNIAAFMEVGFGVANLTIGGCYKF